MKPDIQRHRGMMISDIRQMCDNSYDDGDKLISMYYRIKKCLFFAYLQQRATKVRIVDPYLLLFFEQLSIKYTKYFNT